MTGAESEKIGVLTAKVAGLEKQVEQQGELLREVRDTIIATKGSWKTLVAIGGLLMALSSLVTGVVLKFWPQGH